MGKDHKLKQWQINFTLIICKLDKKFLCFKSVVKVLSRLWERKPKCEKGNQQRGNFHINDYETIVRKNIRFKNDQNYGF